MLVTVLSAIAAAVIVGVVVLGASLGWAAEVSVRQRTGLVLLAAGLVGAAPARAMQAGVGLFDFIFLLGLAIYLLDRHGPEIVRRADAADGAVDGVIHLRRGVT